MITAGDAYSKYYNNIYEKYFSVRSAPHLIPLCVSLFLQRASALFISACGGMDTHTALTRTGIIP